MALIDAEFGLLITGLDLKFRKQSQSSASCSTLRPELKVIKLLMETTSSLHVEFDPV